MKETDVNIKARDMLRCEYPGHWELRHPDQYEGDGVADITGCYHGFAVAIERKNFTIKDPEKARRPEQVLWAESWIKAGGAYLCTNDDTFDEIRAFMDSLRAIAIRKYATCSS